MVDYAKEKNKRFDLTFGIIIAALVGFLLNLLANLYYDLFIVHSVVWEKVDHTQVFGMVLGLIGMFGFLQFFIEDYKNELRISKTFLKRFYEYFFYHFTPGKWMRILTGIYVVLVLLIIIVGLYFVMASFTGYIPATLMSVIVFIRVYWEEKL